MSAHYLEASSFLADVDSKLALSDSISSLYTYLSAEATQFKQETAIEAARLRGGSGSSSPRLIEGASPSTERKEKDS